MTATMLATPEESGEEESSYPYFYSGRCEACGHFSWPYCECDPRLSFLCYEDPRLHECHCGAPIYVNDDIEPGWTRGLCRECD